ncbi:MAG: T9SS type A sorting domain-containing protein [Saprospiraceae bacterium]|nr:T9SS type A sorting domain-containing protein [Saprospiraceae bacterium]
MRRILIIVLTFALLKSSQVQAQVRVLQDYIAQKHNFKEICKKADKMIRKNKLEDASYREGIFRKKSDKKEFLDDEKLKFERWKWYWRDRVTESGEFPDLQRQWVIYNQILKQGGLNLRNTQNWKHEGPNRNSGGYWGMGRTTHVGFHPTQTNTFFVASPNGGLWKTADNGKTYTSIADNLPYQPVGIVLVDPTAANTLYITLGEKDGWWQYSMGVYKSTDGGKNWSATGLNWKLTDNKVIYALEMNPLNSSILMAATSDGLYKTFNGGIHWTKIKTENYSDVKYKPGDTNTVFIALNDYWGQCNVLKSTDGGNTFLIASDFGFQKAFLRLATTQANAAYLGVNMSVDGERKLYISKNTGLTFDYVSEMPENKVLFFSPSNTSILYCGYVVIYKSIDGGKTWTQITNWWNNGNGLPEVHADHHFILNHPSKKEELYFCCDGGVYRYHEKTEVWDELVNNLPITQFYKLAISTTNPPTIIGGSQDNGGWIKRANGSWGNTNGGDAMSQVIDPLNANIGYTEYWGGNAVYRTTNGFNNLDDITQNIGAELPGQWVTPFGLNPRNSKTFIIAYNDVFVSHDRGNSFKKISNNLTGNIDNDLRNVKINPVDSQLVVASRGNTFYISKDFGKSWKSNNLVTSLEITDYEFHPKDTNKMWCVRGGYGAIKVMFSKDKGSSWTNITKNFVNTPTSCIIFDEASNTLFVGTDFGVFYSDADTLDWQYYGIGLPHTAVTDLKIHPTLRKLYISTYGRGFYSIDLPYCAPAQINLLVQVDNGSFENRDSLKICSGSIIKLKAQDSLSGSFRWRGPNLDTTLLNESQWNAGTFSNAGRTSGNYILEYTSEIGCKRLDTIYIRFLNRPNFSINQNHPYFDCHFDSIQLKPSLTIDTLNYTYKWTGPNLDVPNYTAFVKESGRYYLELKNLAGNCSFYEFVDVFRVYDPILDSTIIKSNLCFGDSMGSIKVDVLLGKSPYKYLWSNQKTSSEINSLIKGTYFITVQDANLCEVIDTFTITEPEDLNIIWTINASSGNNGFIELKVTGGTPPYTFLWTQKDGSIIVGQTKDLYNLPAGIFDLKISDANQCDYIKKGIEVKDFVSNDNFIEKGFGIYPNPVKDHLLLITKNPWSKNLELQCLDMQGKRILLSYQKLDQFTIQTNVAHLSAGDYILIAKSTDQKAEIKFSKL